MSETVGLSKFEMPHIPARWRDRSLLVAIFFMLPASAMALCTDAAQPDVDWTRCELAERPFAGIDIRNGQLRDANLQRSVLDEANLSAIDGRNANFISGSLKGTNLAGADLRGADFTKAVLGNANMAGADLRRARFFKADLRGANLTGARMTSTDILKADFSGATWIDGTTTCAEGSVGQCKSGPLKEAPPSDDSNS